MLADEVRFAFLQALYDCVANGSQGGRLSQSDQVGNRKKQSVKEMRPDSGFGRRRDDFRGRVEENLAGPGDRFYIEGEVGK